MRTTRASDVSRELNAPAAKAEAVAEEVRAEEGAPGEPAAEEAAGTAVAAELVAAAAAREAVEDSAGWAEATAVDWVEAARRAAVHRRRIAQAWAGRGNSPRRMWCQWTAAHTGWPRASRGSRSR